MRESSGAVWAGGGCLASMRLGAAAELGLLGKVLRALGTGQGGLTRVATLVGQQHVLAEALATVVAGEYLLPGWRRQGVATQLSKSHLALRGFGQLSGWTSKRRHGCGRLAFESHI